MFRRLVTKKLWLLLPVALMLTGCPAKVNPTPTPEEQTLSISLSEPFSQTGDGNWAAELSPDRKEVSITISSSKDWKASSSDSWCSLSASAGKADDSYLLLTVAANDTYEERSATVTIKASSLSRTISIKQQAKVKEPFSLSPTEVELEATGGTFTVKVNCPTTYKLSDKPDWVKDNTTAGSGNVHTFSVGANPEYEARRGVLVFCDDIGTCLPVMVTQKAREGTPYQMDWSKDFYRRSLFLRFTGTWCGFCPRMSRAQDRVSEAFPDRLEVAALHDMNSLLRFTGTASIQIQYAISSYPTMIVDGRCKVRNAGSVEQTYQNLTTALEKSYNGLPTVTGIGMTSSLNGDKLSVTVDLFVKKAGSYKVTLFVLESGIDAEQADNDMGANPHYIHNNVVRVAGSAYTGDAFTTTTDNKVLTKDYSVTLPSGTNKNALRIIAFVQRAYDATVSKLEPGDFDGYFVDNCVGAAPGTTVLPAIKNSSEEGNEDFGKGNPVNW